MRGSRPVRTCILGAGVSVCVLAALASVACTMYRHETRDNPGPLRAAGTAPPEAKADACDVLLAPSAPLAKGRNALWCATIQLAWDELGRVIGRPSALRVGPPARPETVEALNRGAFPRSDLDEASYVVSAATGATGLGAFHDRMAKLPGASFPFADPVLRPGDVAVMAYLQKDLPFRQPFHVHEYPMSFAGGPRRVATFGMQSSASGGEASRMGEQVTVHSTGDEETSPVAVELSPREHGDLLVLAAVSHPASLEAGWEAASRLVNGHGRTLDAGDELQIPKIDFATTTSFSELEGARLLDTPSGVVVEALQRNEFTLSEAGARLVSSVRIRANNVGAIPQTPRHVVVRFDRPFLLAMIRRGATRPYFLCWFENDDLFVKSPGS